MNTTLPFRTALGTLWTVITLLLGMTVGPVGAAAAQPVHATTSSAGLRPAAQRWHTTRNLSMSQLPADLASVVRQTLARQQRTDYRILAQGNCYLAASPRQNMQTVFTPAGPRLSGRGWTSGMRLVGMGRGRIEHVAGGRMVPQGSTLAYRRGSLTEWYRNSPSELEQGFTLGARPAGPAGKAITLQLGLSGNLHAQLVGRQTYAGAGEVFTRSGATWSYQTQLDLGTGAAANDHLGRSVALSSDGNTALLGAEQRTVGGQSNAGAGEVFVSAAPTVARVLHFSVHRPATGLTTQRRAEMPLQLRSPLGDTEGRDRL